MGKLVLDQELRKKLNGSAEEMEICDEQGRTIGYFLPVDIYTKLAYAAAEAACPFDKAELERRRRETGARPLSDIWKTLGANEVDSRLGAFRRK